ncbi:MAG TPA: CRISPR-associated protein Cas4 [Clostridiaceae bacterium]|jgi:CRISPR-associated exonuclease Cas4|nr:CRISPR-associated protein Cas4 [Clostridiaceae bacterium]HBG37780.1 CRISPR-associated protein Cas4 [Clostridiaceae bacterium]
MGVSEINGTLIWYYNICKKEVWFMSHSIVPDQGDENIDLGKFIHEFSYKRDDKEVSFGNVKFDVVFQSKQELVIGETKKSSKYEQASKWQLMYYLKVLNDAGINARGVLLYPQERKRTDVNLNDKAIKKLEVMVNDIERITNLNIPPEIESNRYCIKCGYREYCFA